MSPVLLEGRRAPRLSRAALAAIGTVGVGLFVVGLVSPILAWAPESAYLRVVVAVAGGALAGFGWSRYRDAGRFPGPATPDPSARARSGLPSLEVYTPPGTKRRGSDRRPKTALATVGLLLALAVLLVLPTPSLLSLGAGANAAAAHPSAAPSVDAARPGTGLTPVCSIFYPPPYTTFNGLYPPLPNYATQSPCKTPHDELHMTFSSSVTGSGQSFRVPIYLPNAGVPGQQTVYGDVYLGMVVQGDSASVGGQSYAELAFTPEAIGASLHWRMTAAVWSLILDTNCSKKVGANYVPSGLNVSYNNHFGCVLDETGGGNGTLLDPGLAPATWANVTFTGSATLANHPLTVYFNDSTTPANSTSFTFSATKTGSHSFQPEFATACPTLCLLNWSTPFGLGVGVDLCETTCFSYNASTQLSEPPIEVGSPEYWTGLAYAGDYRYLGPVSSSGACSGTANVVPCDAYETAGSYPFFTFNGSQLDFGGNYTFAPHDFGGPYVEFNALGTINQYVGLYLDELTNSSRAGYVAPGLPLNVSVRVQDLGNVSQVNLSYVLPGGSPVNESMALLTGLPSNGLYNASVPATGLNGTIGYRVWATNAAGVTLALPTTGSPVATVNRTTVPYVTANLLTVPGACGGISIGGGPALPNGSAPSLLAGRYAISSPGCYPYRFAGWHTTGGLQVTGTGTSASLLAHANGTLTATWLHYRPLDSVALAFAPSSCGGIDLNGTVYPAGTTGPVLLRDGITVALGEAACGGESFSGWSVTNATNLSILGPALTLHGNGTLTALFAATGSAFSVGLATSPAACGGLRVREVGYVTGDTLTLPSGTYPVGPEPCAGWGFAGNVSTTGSVSVSGPTLTVTGAGTVTFSYYKLTLVTIVTLPAACGAVLWDGTLFTNGNVLNVTNHTQHAVSAQPCTGDYLEALSATGNVTLLGATTVQVDGPGTLQATFRAGSPTDSVAFLTLPGTCGAVLFDGTAYANSGHVSVAPNTVATVSTVSCAGYGFVNWTFSGGVTVVGGLAYVNGSGSITAIFHPLVEVAIFTLPSNCGTIDVNGVSLANNATVMLPEDNVYPILPDPCAYQALSEWRTSAGAVVANGTLTLTGTSTVTAVYVPALYPVQVEVAAGGCGQVTVGVIAYTTGTNLSLAAGAYPIQADLCTGYALSSWSTTADLSVAGATTATLTVRGPGRLIAVGAAVPPSLSLSVPSSAAAGTSVALSVAVAVPVPPYNYSYAWSFGDGTTTTVAANATTHVYARPGTYTVRVVATDPLGRQANATTTVAILAVAGGPSFAISPLTAGVIGLGAALVVVGALVSMRRARRMPRPAPGETSADGSSTPPE